MNQKKMKKMNGKKTRLIDANALMNRIDHDTAFSALLEELLDEQPTIDAEPVRHGKWIYHIDSESIGETWICSECNGEELCKTKFCPYCGARMDE